MGRHRHRHRHRHRPRLRGNRVHLSLDRRAMEGITIIRVSGEVDGGSAERLDDEVEVALDPMPAHLIVDLAAVTFIDSAGVRAVLRKRATTVALDTHLHVVVTGAARKVFDLTGLAEGMPLHPTLEDALGAIRLMRADLQ
ncbi:STAS domain-containing protein [Georgenia sp.]